MHGLEVVPDQPLVDKLTSMLDTFRDDPGRVDFGELWRNYSYVMVRGGEGGGAGGASCVLTCFAHTPCPSCAAYPPPHAAPVHRPPVLSLTMHHAPPSPTPVYHFLN